MSRSLVAAPMCFLVFAATLFSASPNPVLVQEAVLAEVNKDKITEAHVEVVGMLSGIKTSSPAVKKRLLERLIENRLVTANLKRRGQRVSLTQVSQKYKSIKEQLLAQGIDLKSTARALGLKESSVRSELEAGELWRGYRKKTITNAQQRMRFEDRKQEFDGTRLQASQIFLKVSGDNESQWKTAESRLARVRQQIVSKQMTFAAAAKQHSDSPSRGRGGDIGTFPYSGASAPIFARQAFGLSMNTVSKPIRSRLGIHLILVTKKVPGDLSLEDARPAVLGQLSQELWDRLVKEETSRSIVKRYKR